MSVSIITFSESVVTLALEALLTKLGNRALEGLVTARKFVRQIVQSGWSGCHTGNIEKLSNSQVCCLAQLCLAAA